MGLDIRIPIGAMFSLLGAILMIFGIVGSKEIYAKSLGINVNLWWGVVMLAFGIVMLVLGRRGTSAMRSSHVSTEGQIIEDREHMTGLENDKNRRGH